MLSDKKIYNESYLITIRDMKQKEGIITLVKNRLNLSLLIGLLNINRYVIEEIMIISSMSSIEKVWAPFSVKPFGSLLSKLRKEK